MLVWYHFWRIFTFSSRLRVLLPYALAWIGLNILVSFPSTVAWFGAVFLFRAYTTVPHAPNGVRTDMRFIKACGILLSIMTFPSICVLVILRSIYSCQPKAHPRALTAYSARHESKYPLCVCCSGLYSAELSPAWTGHRYFPIWSRSQCLMQRWLLHIQLIYAVWPWGTECTREMAFLVKC